jgi:DNA-binding LacI/PurR family transcriptional regulator
VSDAQPPAQRPTISDVARAAAVSKATVSAVLNDAPGVRESTRERVREAMERLNYRPARAVPGRSGPRHQPAVGAMIALIIKEHDNPYYAAIVDGVRSVLEAGGHSLLIVSTGGDSAAERRAVTRLHAAGVDGFIVTPVLGQDGDLSHFFELRRRNVPLVLLERVRGLPASLVDVDNVDVSRAAVEHLIGLGHTRIAHLVGPGYSMHSHERVDGVRRAFSASRLMLRDEDLVPAGAHLEDGYRAGLAASAAAPTRSGPRRHLLQRPGGDRLCRAPRRARASRARGRLGGRLRRHPLCTYVPVPLTTVRVPMQEMGVQSARLLLQILTAHAAVPRGARLARGGARGARVHRAAARRHRGRIAAVPAGAAHAGRLPCRRPAHGLRAPCRAPRAPLRDGADARLRRAGPPRAPPPLHPTGRRGARAARRRAPPRFPSVRPAGRAPSSPGAPTPLLHRILLRRTLHMHTHPKPRPAPRSAARLVRRRRAGSHARRAPPGHHQPARRAATGGQRAGDRHRHLRTPASPSASAQVSLEGTRLGALTSQDGRFTIPGVPAARTPCASSASASRRARRASPSVPSR